MSSKNKILQEEEEFHGMFNAAHAKPPNYTNIHVKNYMESQKSSTDYLAFWTAMGTTLPKLSNLLLNTLTIPASSGLVEQSFLYSNNYKTDKRSLLSNAHLDDVLQLFYAKQCK